ncbi:LacI family DNA-binding transcriptional regulator [Fictibacillus enclensis]|nr:LacI family DNA-binding transcriptional regulator [Fictibacillus enclensis]MDM5338543.1 LacI family DNA-binding transcriptional regulator [Fictibacillus enclensis]
MNKVTIKDVAREAGVSISTVSNALNNVDVLLPKTKDHVLRVAKKMNYIPNLNGKNLKSRATKVLGLFITSMQGPYYGILTDSIYKECEKHGYELNVFITKNEQNALSNILGKRIDGAIISNEWIKENHIETFEQTDTPIVFLDREKASKTISSVVFDSYRGGQTVAKYLINQGHKRIAYIHGYPNLYDDIERFRGFSDTLKATGIDFSEENRLTGYFEEAASYSAVIAFLKSGKSLPDAFFAANDLSAIGCIKALKAEGLIVPDDVSVIGFDNIELSEVFSPSLTTVNNPIARQGKLAVQRLLSTMQQEREGRVEKLEGNLIIRNSCNINKNVLI